MIDKYLDYAIHYDYTFVVCKYTTQQILGSLQASEMGERFLASATMRDLCAVFGRESDLEKRKAWIKAECERLGFGLLPTSCEVSMRQGTLAPSKGAVADTRCVHYVSLSIVPLRFSFLKTFYCLSKGSSGLMLWLHYRQAKAEAVCLRSP